MALQWKVLLPLAAVWLAVAAGIQWMWTPRAVERGEAQYRAQVTTTLRMLAADLAPMLKEGRPEAADAILESAVWANPEWLAIDLRDSSGRVLERVDTPEPRADSTALRRYDQPITDAGSVVAWLSATIDIGRKLAAVRARQRDLLLLLLGGLAAALAVTAVAIRRFVERPLARLAATADAAGPARSGKHAAGGRTDAWGRLQASMSSLRNTLSQRERDLLHEAERRRKAEERLHAAEERYAAAVRGVDDGLWEWDLASGLVFYSARWKSMLGYAEHEIADDLDEWRGRIHPDDREYTMGALQRHIEGETGRFESDHRVRHHDGHYLWVLARGTALRSATGTPYRVVGLNTDISVRKRAEGVLLALAEGLANVRGEEFFQALVRNFARVLGVDCAFITECVDHPATRVRELASWKDDRFIPTEEYELHGTPCHETVNLGRVCVYARDVGVVYPLEQGWESYLGIPIFDTGGRVIGHLACYGSKVMEDLPVQSIFSLFAVRAGVEMERRGLQRRLDALKRRGSA